MSVLPYYRPPRPLSPICADKAARPYTLVVSYSGAGSSRFCSRTVNYYLIVALSRLERRYPLNPWVFGTPFCRLPLIGCIPTTAEYPYYRNSLRVPFTAW